MDLLTLVAGLLHTLMQARGIAASVAQPHVKPSVPGGKGLRSSDACEVKTGATLLVPRDHPGSISPRKHIMAAGNLTAFVLAVVTSFLLSTGIRILYTCPLQHNLTG
jgi:hypothetical protein